MQGLLEQINGQLAQLFGPHVVRILGALAVLVGGWIAALVSAAVVRAARISSYSSNVALRSDSTLHQSGGSVGNVLSMRF